MSQFVLKSGSLLACSTRASSSPATLISSRKLWEWLDSTFFLFGEFVSLSSLGDARLERALHGIASQIVRAIE